MESLEDDNAFDEKSIPSPVTHRYVSYYDDDQYQRFPAQIVDDDDEDNDYYQMGFKPRYRGYMTILITITCIVLFQFQGPLIRMYHNAIARWNGIDTWQYDPDYRNNDSYLGIIQGFIIGTFISIYDYIWFGWYTVMELIRNLVLGFYSFFPWFLKEDNILISNYDPTRIGDQNDGHRIGGDRRNINALPDLERGETLFHNNNTNVNLRYCQTFVELEPSFVCEDDFPEGWMVYHPILGVVMKTAADKYNYDQYNNNAIASLSTNSSSVRAHDHVTENNSKSIGFDSKMNPDTTNNCAINGVSKSISDDDHDLCSRNDQTSNVKCLRSVAVT